MMRYSEEDNGQVDQRLRREVEIWRTLNHKNVLPFIGLCDDLARWPALLSPFCGFGHVANYINKYPHASRDDLVIFCAWVDILLLIPTSQAYGVACGLHYLDEKNVIHGDLKVVRQQSVILKPEFPEFKFPSKMWSSTTEAFRVYAILVSPRSSTVPDLRLEVLEQFHI
jgi:serine/threonine protein kinase